MNADLQKLLNLKNNMQIIPSMLVSSQEEFETQIEAVQTSVEMVQLDLADGKFVPNTTWSDPEVARKVLKINAELHLMVADPIKTVVEWMGVPQIKRVLFHYESVASENIAHTIRELGRGGWQVGMVLNPNTPIDVVDEHVEHLDAVMFMGVNPGFQGQSYIPQTTQRMKSLKEKYPDLFISLDGGVNLKTIPDIFSSNIDAICPGSAVFRTDKTPSENVADIRALIASLT